MAKNVSSKTANSKSKEFILMGHTRALLGDVWDHWRSSLGQTPDVAKRMMTAAIKEMHKAETAALKKKNSIKKTAKKIVKKKIVKKAKKSTRGR